MSLDTTKPLRAMKIDGVAKPILGQGVPQEVEDIEPVTKDENIGNIYEVVNGDQRELYIIVEDETNGTSTKIDYSRL